MKENGNRLLDGLLNKKEQQKLEVIKKVISNDLTKKEASYELELTIRQINRLIQKYVSDGEDGFAHKSRGKERDKKINDDIKEAIVNLYMSDYYDYNFTHFYEEIEEKYDVSFVTVCNILQDNDIISPEAQHKTVKSYNEKMKKSIKEGTITDEQQQLYEERQELEKQKHVRRSTLLYNYGQEVQMDATLYIWFGDIATMLHLAVDKATKKVLAGWFDYQETTEAYCILLMIVLLIWGIPELIKTDKRGCFSLNNAKLLKSNLNTTQFGRICKDLDIKLSCSSDPLFKPNVERENKTFKGRLKSELRHENINTIEEANKYLNEVFIPKMNDLFSYDINANKNSMRENTYTKEELNIIISERYKRTIDNASSLKFKGKYFIPIDINTNEKVMFAIRTECIFVIAYDKSYWCYINDILYKLLEIEPYQKEEKEKLKKEPKYKGHKPSPNHPWRNYKNRKKE